MRLIVKFVFIFVEGLKSEPVLDINELKSMGLNDKIMIGETISVLLEKMICFFKSIFFLRRSLSS